MFEIYGRSNCSYCDAAMNLLELGGYSYKYHDIEKDPKALSEFKFMFPNAKTVPQICTGMNDVVQIIGGYTELYEWLSTRKS